MRRPKSLSETDIKTYLPGEGRAVFPPRKGLDRKTVYYELRDEVFGQRVRALLFHFYDKRYGTPLGVWRCLEILQDITEGTRHQIVDMWIVSHPDRKILPLPPKAPQAEPPATSHKMFKKIEKEIFG